MIKGQRQGCYPLAADLLCIEHPYNPYNPCSLKDFRVFCVNFEFSVSSV